MEQNKDRVQNIVDRMKKVLGVSKDKELAESLGGARSTPGAWKVRGTIPYAECVLIAETKGVSLDWLILGRGPDPTEALAANADKKPGEVLQPFMVSVPAFDMAAPFELDDTSEQAWYLPRLWLEKEGLSTTDTIVVIAAGDSMHPEIRDGHPVVVDRRPRDTDGVVLVRFGETYRLKRMQRMIDGSTRLSSDNQAYAAEVLRPGDESKIEIIGHCHAAFVNLR